VGLAVVGDRVGLLVGMHVGENVGTFEGAFDGLQDGIRLGFMEGKRVKVGSAVGFVDLVDPIDLVGVREGILEWGALEGFLDSWGF